MVMLTWPPMRSVTAGAVPLYGTCTRSSPKRERNSSPVRCGGVPPPAVAKVYLPGAAFASATKSFTEPAGIAVPTLITSGMWPMSATGAKSRVTS